MKHVLLRHPSVSIRIAASLLAALTIYGLTVLHAWAKLDYLLFSPAFHGSAAAWQFRLDFSTATYAALILLVLSIPAHLAPHSAGRVYLALLLAATSASLYHLWRVVWAFPELGCHGDPPSTVRVHVISFLVLGLTWVAHFRARRSSTFFAYVAFSFVLTLFLVFFAAPGTIGFPF